MFKVTDNTKTAEELRQLEERDDKLPLYSREEIKLRSGVKGVPTAWIVVKGVIYDVTGNAVYKSEGNYNLFAGNDVTIALAKMEFDKVGSPDWRKKLSLQELCVLEEWVKWYRARYAKVGYVKEEY